MTFDYANPHRILCASTNRWLDFQTDSVLVDGKEWICLRVVDGLDEEGEIHLTVAREDILEALAHVQPTNGPEPDKHAGPSDDATV